MALKNKIFLAIALSTLLGMASAHAYIIPGGSRPEPPPQGDIRPLPPGGPQQPLPPGPIPQPGDGGGYNPYPGDGGYNPYPGNGGGYGPGNGGYNGQEQRAIQIRRRVINENLPLLQLAGLDRRYEGYTVQSVTLYVSGSGPRSQATLLINNQYDASVASPRGMVTLIPRYQAVLGQVRTLQLSVSGGIDLDTVVLTLTAPQNGGGPREITVPLAVARRMLGNDRLDISPYIDMYQYRGMRITAIEIEANALYQVAFLDVLINSFPQGQSLQLGNYIQRYTVYPQDAVIGQSAASIVLSTRGDLDIRGVTLRLSRR